MLAMPAWDRPRLEEQRRRVVAPALAMPVRDPASLDPPLRGGIQQFRHQETRPPPTTTGLPEPIQRAPPAPAMLTRGDPRHQGRLFKCQSMPRSSVRLLRRAADHLMEDQAQAPLELKAETANHHRTHRVPPRGEARVAKVEHQMILRQAGILLEMVPNKRRKRRKRKEARLRTRQTHHIRDEGSVK